MIKQLHGSEPDDPGSSRRAALLLKHYSRHGRFPRGRSDLPEEVITFVARQLDTPVSHLGFYEWTGSTIEYHRAQIRTHLGFRVASLADQERLTIWLTSNVAHAERRPERVREYLLAEFRRVQIEPPTSGRVLRMVRSAMRTAERSWALRIAGRLTLVVTARLLNLIAARNDADDASDCSETVFGFIKASPGNVSLESMMIEISKLQAARAIGPGGATWPRPS